MAGQQRKQAGTRSLHSPSLEVFKGTAVLPYLNYGKVKYSSITLDRVGHGDELVFVYKPWLFKEELALQEGSILEGHACRHFHKVVLLYCRTQNHGGWVSSGIGRYDSRFTGG